MIELVSVEVVNVRAIGHVYLEDLVDESGHGVLTAINGPVGAGKSTIITSILWAMYGVTPKGVPVSGMRRQGSAGQECRVTVVFRFNGQHIEVTRGLKGVKDSAYATVKADGVEQAVSAKAVPAWMTAKLGIDVHGFTTAFLIQQKSLDSLVTAVPSERRKIIERLAGIDRMSAAVKSAREEANTRARILADMPGSTEEVETAQAGLDAATEQYNTASNTATQAQNVATVARTEADQAAHAATEAETAAQGAQQLIQAVHAAGQQVAVETARVESATAEHDRVRTEATSTTTLTVEEAQAAVTAAEQAEADGRALWDATRDATRAMEQAAQVAGQARSRATQSRQAADRRAAEAAKTTDTDADTLTKTADEAALFAAKAQQSLGGLRTAYTLTQQDLKHLDETGTCRRCTHAPTGEERLTLRDQIARELADLQNRGQAASKAAEDAERTADRAREAATGAREAAHASVQAGLWVAEAEQAATADETAAVEAEQSLAAATAAQEDAATKFAAVDVDAVKAATTHARANLTQAQQAATVTARVNDAQARLGAAQAALQTAQEAETAAREAAAGAEDVLTAAAQARQVANTADVAARDAEAAHTTASAEVRVCAERVRSATQARDRAQAAMEARQTAMVEAEQARLTAVSLAEFREDRLARLAPELSEIATDFLTRMTDGKYTRVELDEEFTPILTDEDGWDRPVSFLSGGEESAVAMALRIGIGEVVAGRRGGLLILDEAFTSQDANRRAAMVSELRALGRQIITINHVSEATDMADKVIEIVPGEDGGHAAPGDATAGDELVNLEAV